MWPSASEKKLPVEGFKSIPGCPSPGRRSALRVLLTPAVGAVLMSASTVVVGINARLLRLKE